MEKHRLELVGITYNQIESGVYAVILREVGGERRIPIIIGYPEAQAIECKLQDVVTPRPLTHDMMLNFMTAFGVSLKEIEIKRLPNGVFAADLIFSDGENTRIVDARSSDGIALAIRAGAPIYT
ncbi:MAG: bifunctional nuclease family protein, partial [Muribaculaceae bacterium]|nr:bifunctional nuclease family protein [Muribaculaceae bacterium]